METLEPTYKEIGQPLPTKKEALLLKIFDVLRGCTYDSQGVNTDWKSMEIEHRAKLKKFFKESIAQFKDI